MLDGPSSFADLGAGIAARTGRRQVAPSGRRRLDWRFVLLGAIFGFAALELLYFMFRPAGVWEFALFADSHSLFAAAQDWIAGRGFYEAYQLGPHVPILGEILYPPITLILLVPFSFLPDLVWVLVPLALLVYIVRWWRPDYWGFVGIGLCLCVPTAFGPYLWGNPSVWLVAFVALATRWPAFGPLVLIKPTLAPFALVGIRHWSWWATVGVLAVSVVLMWPLWMDWFTAIRYFATPTDWAYSLPVAPLMLIPLVARWRRTRQVAPLAGPPEVATA